MMKSFWALRSFFLILSSSLLLASDSWGQENDYTIPLRFKIVGDGVDLGPVELDFDLESQNSLRMGDIVVSSKTMTVQLGMLEDLSPALMPFLTEEEREDSYLVLTWPEPLVTEGIIEAISQSGRVFWKASLPKSEIDRWKDFKSEVRDRMAEKMRKGEIDDLPLMNATWAQKSFLRNNEAFTKSTEPFRFCITQTRQEGQSRLCYPYMEFVRKDRKVTLQKTPEPLKSARIILFQKESPLKVRRPVKLDAKIQFLADLSEGQVYEFTTLPPKINIVEMVRTPQGVKVVGHGQVPSRTHSLINPLTKSLFIQAIGWDATIGDFREFWETKMSESEPTLFFRGPGGGLFRQDYRIKRLPREENRVYLHRRTLPGTYVNSKRIYGIKPTKNQVSSTENEVHLLDNAPDEFVWRFMADKRGDPNEAILTIKDGKETFKAYHELFKGYPGELGFRMPLILGTGGNFLAAGEFAANYWFDTLGGWSNYYVSNQRWGVGGKYLQTLTPVKISGSSTEYSSGLNTIALDLKYRLRPGLWNRDETVGLILGYNNVKYDLFTGSMLGVGGFWARSMPKIFDDLFNLIPFMRYPKWVDMEFIYYAQTLNPGTVRLRQLSGQSGGNWSLNFHGKVHWFKSFYGEAGFGIRSLDFIQKNPNDTGLDGDIGEFGFRFGLVYGTAGLGYQF